MSKSVHLPTAWSVVSGQWTGQSSVVHQTYISPGFDFLRCVPNSSCSGSGSGIETAVCLCVCSGKSFKMTELVATSYTQKNFR